MWSLDELILQESVWKKIFRCSRKRGLSGQVLPFLYQFFVYTKFFFKMFSKIQNLPYKKWCKQNAEISVKKISPLRGS